VRQALAYLIDRGALLEILTDNKGVLREVFTHPQEEGYDVITRAASIRYRPDARKAQQLLEEAGFAKGADGQWRTPRGDRFTLEQWYLASAGNERESQIVVDALRRFGIEATSQLWGVQRTSAEERAKTSGLFAGSITLPNDFATKNIAGPANRWTGANRYGYSNPELDGYVDAWETTLDTSQRIQHMANAERVVNAELPALSMYFRQRVLAHSSNLGGVVENLTPGAGSERRVWEWYWKA
jgi:ABC-type transport system substrate-binding protein